MWVAKVLSLHYLLVISVPMLSKSHGWLALMLLGWDHPASWSRPECGCQANLGPSLALSRTPCVTFNCICLSFRICKRRTKRKTCLLVELLGILGGTLSKHLVQRWRQSRPSMNDNCSRSLLHPQSERVTSMCRSYSFMFPDTFASSTCPSFLPIPCLFLNGENSSFPADFRGLFGADKGETRGGALGKAWSPTQPKQELNPDNNRKPRHLEVFLAAAGGLCQIPPRILPGAAPECSRLREHRTRLTAGRCASSKPLS